MHERFTGVQNVFLSRFAFEVYVILSHIRFVRLSLAACLVALAVITFSPSAFAQVGTQGDTTATPIFGPGNSYITDLNETVDPEYGSLSIRVAAPLPHERGLNLPLYPFMYDSNEQPTATPNWSSGQASNGAQYVSSVDFETPLTLGRPNTITEISTPISTYIAGQPASCTLNNNYVYTDPSGGRHPLSGLQGVNNQAENGCLGMNISPSPEGQTAGDAQYTAVATNWGNTVYVYDRFGNLMSVNGDTSLDSVVTYEDTNGNRLRPSGRTYSTSNTSTTIPGLGAPYVSSTSSPYSTVGNNVGRGSSTPLSLNVTPGVSNGADCTKTFSLTVGGYFGTSYLALPNGQQYQFKIDPQFGLINHIDYPTGSSVDYTWGINPHSQALLASQPSSVPSEFCSYIYDWTAITKRVVSINGVKTQEQDFSYTTTWNGQSWTSKTTTVVTKDLISAGTPSYKTVYTYGAPNNLQISSHTAATYDTAGNLLATSSTTADWSGSPISQCTTIAGANLTNGTFYQYSARQIVDKAEYDYGLVSSACSQPSSSVTPTRETKTVYQTFSDAPMISNRPASVQVYANGTLLSETDYKYDEYTTYPLVSVPGVLGHDTNYSYTSTRSRGNATTVTQKCFLTGSFSCPYSITHAAYDETGQVVKSWDANGNLTQYSYADNYTNDDGTAPQSAATNTYVTQITRPTVNGVTHTSSFMYDFNGGKLRYATDENSKTTQYCYWTNGCSGSQLDKWLRLTQTVLPDGGGTTYGYTDSSSSAIVTSTTLATPDPSIVTQATYDPLGRITSTVVTSAGNITTDTKYNGFGQVVSVSNPYITTSDATYGLTTYQYDSLGRKTIETPPNSSTSKQWCYNNIPSSGQTNCSARAGSKANVTWTDVSDEVGNHSQDDLDGLGRLVAVLEPNASNIPTLETDYTYDGHDNLLQADQWGGPVNTAGERRRTFEYDSLSRLVVASNPESGITCYGTANASNPPAFSNCTESYDGNGNLKAKTDARGTQINYTYDALNRLTSKTGSGINYSYWFDKDPNSSITATNAVGRLAYQSNGGNSDRHYSYDSVGRTVSEKGSSPTNAGISANSVTAGYDLAGALASMTYPDGRLVSFGYDAAARMTSVTDKTNSAATIPYASSIQYFPPGQLSSAMFGNGVEVVVCPIFCTVDCQCSAASFLIK